MRVAVLVLTPNPFLRPEKLAVTVLTLSPKWCYDALQDQWLDCETNRRFLMQHNPWALRDMSERFLEAANRGLWSSATEERLEQIKKLVLQAETTVENGPNQAITY